MTTKNVDNNVDNNDIENLKQIIQEMQSKIDMIQGQGNVGKDDIGLDRSMSVAIYNNRFGGLYYRDKITNSQERLSKYGDKSRKLKLSDLESMKSDQSKFIYNGWIYIDNPAVVKELELEELYENLVSPKDINKFFELPIKEIEKKLVKMPIDCQHTIIRLAKKMYDEGKMDSVTKRKAIENIVGISFDDVNYIENAI
jgi:hypothetical protein